MKRQIRVGIVGYGYVGKAMHRFFKDHYEVLVYDKNPTASDVSMADRNQINACDVAVVCVSTPSKADGSCDLGAVEETVRWLETPLIQLKSTVAIGTTDRLKRDTGKRIVFAPEYCGESSYWTPYEFHSDIKETPYYIFGGDAADTQQMVDLYLPVAGPVKKYSQTSAAVAETAKYMENVFFATKITFCYEMERICQALGVSYSEVREAWLLDPRINPMHTAVFARNEKPFSGKCLPKDLDALISSAKNAGYQPEFLEEVLKSNERIGKERRQGSIGIRLLQGKKR